MEDLFLLESYRVSLFQLKPMFTPASLAASSHNALPLHVGDSGGWIKAFLLQQVQILSRKEPAEPLSDINHRTIPLISVASWFAQGRRLGESFEAANRQWQPSVIHSTLETYIKGISEKGEIFNLSLAHMTAISLYTPLSHINDAAYFVSTQQTPDASTSQVLQDWRHSFDMPKALRHASLLLECANDKIASSPTVSSYNEAPHDGLCFFNAALVVWASLPAKEGWGTRSEGPLQAISLVLRAADVLNRLELAAASKMSQVLRVLHDAVLSDKQSHQRQKPFTTYSINQNIP